MHALETKKENSQAVMAFRERLKEVAFRLENFEWGFPNGERGVYPTYSIHTHLGEIQVGVPESWSNRAPHLIRFKKEQGPPSPDVEINIPMEHDRKVSGLYVQADSEYWLCSRGSFTSYRGQIKRDYTFSHFNKWLIEIDDKARSAYVIPVCSLASPTLANDIATFARAVQELKRLHKAGEESSEGTISGEPPSTTTNVWGTWSEFEGKKNGGGGARSEYEYLHGPLCNQLMEFLKKSTTLNQAEFVTKNIHVDVAIVDQTSQKASAIFEIKTSALPSDQIYSAVGQMHYYKFRYGHPKTKLYLVLPSSCKSNETEMFIESLGIAVVYGESGKFIFPSGKSLISGV
jgi:hypothetical protein